jgi:hypothetical protein
MIIYKLTDRAGYTRRGEPGATMWEVGRRYGAHEGDGLSFERGFYDVYTDPLVGLFLNPIHANVKNPQLWEGETPEIIIDQRGVKAVVRELVLVRELQVPEIAPEQRIRFAIFCAASVIPNRNRIWHSWARDWLSGADRTEEVAGWAAGRASWAACAALMKAEAETEVARWASWTPWAALMKEDTETQAAEARWAAWEAGWAAAGAACVEAWEARWAAEKARRATERRRRRRRRRWQRQRSRGSRREDGRRLGRRWQRRWRRGYRFVSPRRSPSICRRSPAAPWTWAISVRTYSGQPRRASDERASLA